MTELGYTSYDADNHYYEPEDCYTRYFPSDQQHRAFRVVERDGQRVVLAGERPFTFLDNPFREYTTKPGALREMLKNLSSGLGEDNPALEKVQPAYVNRDARLQLMDAQGVQACLMFPTVGVCTEHFFDDPDDLYDNLDAFNRWVLDEWGFGADGRIVGAPLINLRDVDRAVAQLEWALDNGARAIAMRPGPAYGRSPADPAYDPFWARVNEARVPVAYHIAESGYNELFSVAWGEEPNPSSHRQSAFQWTNFYGDRPIMDTVSALIYHNLFGRFPDVRIISVENGSLWVPYLLKAMNKMNGMGRNGPWPGGRITEKPSDIFCRHVYVSPYHEEDVVALADVIGASQVLFGSDYPHAEGLAHPNDFVDNLAPLPEDERRAIMRGNLESLLAAA